MVSGGLSPKELLRSWLLTTEPPNYLYHFPEIMIGLLEAPLEHFAVFGLYELIFWLRTLCPCSIRGNLVSNHFEEVGQSPPTHLPPHWNRPNFGFFQMLVRRLWEGPWWFCLIEKWSLMLLLVVWECQGLTLVDLKQLPFDHRTTQRQNPTFTFLWDNDRTSVAPTEWLGQFWVIWSHLLAQNPLSI